MTDDKNKELDDLDNDLLDDLDEEPTVEKPRISPEKEHEKSRLSKLFSKKQKAEKQAESDDIGTTDDLADSTPKVSMATKKNIVLIAMIGLIVFYFAYQIFNHKSDKAKKIAGSEVEKLTEPFREKSKIPDAAQQKKLEESAQQTEQLAQIQEMQAQSQNPISAIDIAVPPPPPPPAFDPSSPYVDDESAEENFEDEDLENKNFEEDDLLSDEDLDIDSPGNSSPTPAPQQSFTKSGGVLVKNKFAPGASGSYQQPGTDGLPQIDGAGSGNPGAVQQDIQQQLNAPMFVSSAAEEVPDEGEQSKDDPFKFELNRSSAAKGDVTMVGNLNNVILQGKVLDAVIETAINTDLPGKLRGIVARDIYAESGKRILIPKGSRLIGTYDTQVKYGQARVFIIWTRVIRPDGIDAVLDSREDMIAVDLLGRSGVPGELDNRFAEVFGSSLLLSTITVAFAYAADAITNPGQITSSVTDTGGVVESGSPVAFGVRQAVSDLGYKTQEVARNLLNVTPRITIDQGTRIKVFVNKDIFFPSMTDGENGDNIIMLK